MGHSHHGSPSQTLHSRVLSTQAQLLLQSHILLLLQILQPLELYTRLLHLHAAGGLLRGQTLGGNGGQLLLGSLHLLLSGRVLLRERLLGSIWQVHWAGCQAGHGIAGVC